MAEHDPPDAITLYAVDALEDRARAELENVSHSDTAPVFDPAEPRAALRARLLAAAYRETQDTRHLSRIACNLRSILDCICAQPKHSQSRLSRQELSRFRARR
jgi:hypothetical protein